MTKRRASRMMKQIYRGYIYKHLLQDSLHFMGKSVRGFESNHRKAFRRVGLTPYSPGKSVLGALGFLFAGGLLGALAGITFSPRSGPSFRKEVKERASEWLGRPERQGYQPSRPADA